MAIFGPGSAIYCEPSAVVCILVRGPRTRDLGIAILTDLWATRPKFSTFKPIARAHVDLQFPHNSASTLYPSSLPRIDSLVFGTLVQVACAEDGVVMRTCKSLGAPTGTVKIKVNRLLLKQY